MIITLKTIKQEETQIEVESPLISVHELKKLIEEKFNYDSTKLKLLFNGVILNDEKSLQSYNIDANSKIIMSNLKPKQTNDTSISNKETPVEVLEAELEDEEKIYTAEVKAEDAIKIVASIMKVICLKNQDKGQEYFKNLKEDNPEINYLINKNQAEFKALLYSPVTSEDKNIFKSFYKGELGIENTQPDELTSEDIKNIQRLTDLGFPEDLAKEAFVKNSKNFDKALDSLLN